MNKKIKLLAILMLSMLCVFTLVACDDTEVKTYTVTYNSNGGTAVASQTVKADEKFAQPTNPTKADNSFLKWHTNKELTSPYSFDTKATKDITLFAEWSANGPVTYTVSFNSNGGSSVVSQTVNAGAKATKPTDPTKADSAFVAWHSNEALTAKFDFANAVSANITLFAEWRDLNAPAYIEPTADYVAKNKTVESGHSINNVNYKFTDETNRFHFIGTDNAVKLPVSVSNSDFDTISKYTLAIKLYEKANYSDILGTEVNLSDYATQGINNELTFLASAHDKIFDIVISLANANTQSYTMRNVKVAKGYNVHSIADLNAVSYASTMYTASVEEDKDKKIKRVPTVNADAIFIQSNLKVTNADIPEALFETAKSTDADYALFQKVGGKGLIDWSGLFIFKKTTTINGNFYSINIDEVAPVVRDNSNIRIPKPDNNGNETSLIAMNAYMFAFSLSGSVEETNFPVNMSNIYLRGNTGVSDATQVLKNGGGMNALQIQNNNDFNASNVHTAFFHSTVVLDGNFSTTNITKLNFANSIAVNTFGLNMMAYGGSQINIIKSIVRDSGGPLIFIDNYTEGAATEGTHYTMDYPVPNKMFGHPVLIKSSMPISSVNIDKDSELENLVTGGEAWFQIMNATPIMGMITSQEGLEGKVFNSYERSVLKKKGDIEYMNMLVLAVASDSFGKAEASKYRTYASATIYDKALNTSFTFDTVAEVTQKFMTTMNAPFCQTSAGGILLADMAYSQAGAKESAGIIYGKNISGSYVNISADMGLMLGGGVGTQGNIGLLLGYYPKGA